MLTKMPQGARLCCENKRLFAACQMTINSFGQLPKQGVEQNTFIVFGTHIQTIKFDVVHSARWIATVAGMDSNLIAILRALLDLGHTSPHVRDRDLNQLTHTTPIDPNIFARYGEPI